MRKKENEWERKGKKEKEREWNRKKEKERERKRKKEKERERKRKKRIVKEITCNFAEQGVVFNLEIVDDNDVQGDQEDAQHVTNITAFIHSIIYSLIHLFIRSLMDSFIHLFVHSAIHQFVNSHPFDYPILSNSLIWTPTAFITQSLVLRSSSSSEGHKRKCLVSVSA